MPATRQRPASSGHPIRSSFTKPCSRHCQEMIKFYCSDHKVLLCNVCVTLEHSVSTCNVKYLPDVSSKTINSKEVTEALKNIETESEKVTKATDELRELTKKSNDSLTHVLEEIQKYRLEINERLDQLEMETKEAIRTFTEENDIQLQAAETTTENIIRSLKSSNDSIKLFNSSKQADKLFVELKSAESLLNDTDVLFSKLSSTQIKRYHFKPHKAILTFLQNETSLGSISGRTMKTVCPLSLSSRQGGIYIKTSSNKNPCWITGMVLMSPSKLVIADHENQCVKLVDIDNQSITNQLDLNNWLWDVTMVTEDKLAVTLPDQKKVQFISVFSNSLEKESCLKVNGQCYGISCFDEKLVVSFNYPGKLEIINLIGNVLMSVTTSSNFEDIFCEPEYVIGNGDSIYVSDCKRKAVLRLNWKGELISKYRSTGVPKGLVMLKDGSFLVAYSHEEKCCIQRVSADCKSGKEVLHDLRHPHVICSCETNNRVYVSYHRAGERNDNCIQIFKV